VALLSVVDIFPGGIMLVTVTIMKFPGLEPDLAHVPRRLNVIVMIRQGHGLCIAGVMNAVGETDEGEDNSTIALALLSV